MTRVTVATPRVSRAERHPMGPPGNYHHRSTLTHVAEPTEAPQLCRATGFRISVTPLVRPVSDLLRHLAAHCPEQLRRSRHGRRTTTEPGRRVTLVLASLAALTLTACSVLVVAGTDRLRSTTETRTSPFLAAPDPDPAPVVVPDPGRYGGQSAGNGTSRPGAGQAPPAPAVRPQPAVARRHHPISPGHARVPGRPTGRPGSADPPVHHRPPVGGPPTGPRDPEGVTCAAQVFGMCLAPALVPEPHLPPLNVPLPGGTGEPAEPGTGRCHPGQSDPGQSDPGQTDPGQAGTGQPEESTPLHPAPGTRSPGEPAPGTHLPGATPPRVEPPKVEPTPEAREGRPSAPGTRTRVDSRPSQPARSRLLDLHRLWAPGH